MEKVLILTYYWPPSGGPGVQRWLKFVKYLPEYGYDPVVITVDPHLATYPVVDTGLNDDVLSGIEIVKTSTREPYALYKKIFGKKQVPHSGFANEEGQGPGSALSRFIRGNFFIPDARKGWNPFAISAAEKLLKKYRIKTLITTSPPHSTQLAGLMLKKKYPHLNWIADLRDPWTDIFYYSKMLHLPFARKRDAKMEADVLHHADMLVTVSSALAELFNSKISKESRKKIQVITNGFDHEDFSDPVPEKEYSDFTITYTGTLSESYYLDGLIKAIEGLPDHQQVRLRIAGSICPLWSEKLENLLGNRLIRLGHVDHSRAIREMQQASMLLLVIPRIENNEGILTGKLFEYLASQRPVMGIGPLNGEAAKILQATQCGTMFDYNDADNMGRFIARSMNGEQMSVPDKDAVIQFSRKELTGKLAELIGMS